MSKLNIKALSFPCGVPIVKTSRPSCLNNGNSYSFVFYASVLFWFKFLCNLHPAVQLRTWWRHQMETFSALLPLCAANSPVTGQLPSQRPRTRKSKKHQSHYLNQYLFIIQGAMWHSPESYFVINDVLLQIMFICFYKNTKTNGFSKDLLWIPLLTHSGRATNKCASKPSRVKKRALVLFGATPLWEPLLGYRYNDVIKSTMASNHQPYDCLLNRLFIAA